MADLIEVSAHFDGERIVVDEPYSFPVGASLRVRVVESGEELKERRLVALRRYSELGKDLPSVDSRYLDDREAYYYGDEVYRGVDHDPNSPS